MLEQNPFLEAEEDSAPAFEPLTERLSTAERAGERESERAAEPGGDSAEAAEPAAIDGTEFASAERDDWENGTEREDFDGIRETPGKSRTNNDFDDPDDSDRDTAAQSLQDHLRDQLAGMRLSPADAAAVLVLIDSLDDDGYLADTLEDIAARLVEGGLDARRPASTATTTVAPLLAPSALCAALPAEHGADRRRRARSRRVPDPAAAHAGSARRRRRSRSSSAAATCRCSRGAT